MVFGYAEKGSGGFADQIDIEICDRFDLDGIINAMNGFGITADQVVPGRQITSRSHQTVGTAFRQPTQLWQLIDAQFKAIWVQAVPVGVDQTAAIITI